MKGGMSLKVLLVGADKIGTKEKYLIENYGATEFYHWDGRVKKHPHMPLVKMVIVLTSFVNHDLMFYVKKEAKKIGAKVVYLKRGIAELKAAS